MYVMLHYGATFVDLGPGEEEIPNIFAPITRPLNRDYGASEAETYILPFFVEFLMMDSPAYCRVMNDVFLDNLLHLADWMRSTPFNIVCMYALASVSEMEAADSLLESQCAEFGGDFSTYPGPWGDVLFQVAIRTADAAPGLEAVRTLLVIASRRLLALKRIPDSSFKTLFKLFEEHADLEMQITLFKIVHFVVGNAASEKPYLVAHLLTSFEFLQRMALENPAVVELTQLFEWIRNQISKFTSVKEEFTRDHLVQLISDPANIVSLCGPTEPPQRARFSICDYVNDITRICFEEYFKSTLKLDFCRPPVSNP
jgi:hypothetical protein